MSSDAKTVWVVWGSEGTALLASFSELNPLYARSSHTVTRETLLTPAQAAVIAAAKAWTDFETSQNWKALRRAVTTLRAQEGE